MNWLATVAELTDTRRAPIPTTEYIFNDATEQVSHLVVEDTFGDFGSATAVCGVEARSADFHNNYDLCAVCTGKDAD